MICTTLSNAIKRFSVIFIFESLVAFVFLKCANSVRYPYKDFLVSQIY
jgi:hypothetical protein